VAGFANPILECKVNESVNREQLMNFLFIRVQGLMCSTCWPVLQRFLDFSMADEVAFACGGFDVFGRKRCCLNKGVFAMDALWLGLMN